MALSSRKLLTGEVIATRPPVMTATDLLPWADPYILRLLSEHEQALAQSQATNRITAWEQR
ncbi:MAG: hypothetical protein SFX18_06650 [Pirellulales bacterium]|nr:hypothetical protein [Pirellulales bacterium]